MSSQMPQPKGWQKRHTLALTGFLGMALMYAIRFNLSIGIVAMVDDSVHRHRLGVKSSTNSSSAPICPDLMKYKLTDSDSDNSSFLDFSEDGLVERDANDGFPKFNWDEKVQGLILGSFFWGYVVSQIPGGLLAQRLGGKWVVCSGILSAGLLSLILPWAAVTGGIYFVLVIRVLQGISEGVVLPAFIVLISKWTTPNERASITTFCFSGMPFGTAVTMIASGHLISSFGWPAVFYAPGILAVLWFFAWALLIYSSPNEHPSVSKSERNLIEISNKDTIEENTGVGDIPWKEMIFSMPFWAILISHFTNTWGHNTLKAEGPKYLHSVLHFDIHENSYIAATPYICQLVVCNVVVRFFDYCLTKKWVSVGAARRLCNTIGQVGTALAYLGLILSDCNRSLAILFFILSGSLNGAVYGGFLVNPIDIAPNYAGAIEGVINGFSNLAGFGGPFVAGLILHSMPTISGWHYVFLIPVIGDLVGNLVFVLFASTSVQPWNSKKSKSAKIET